MNSLKPMPPLSLFQFAFHAMGSPCEIQLYARDHASAQGIAQQAIADANRLEQRYSRYRPDSILSAINQVAAWGGSIQVDEETASLLNYAHACYQQSDGRHYYSALAGTKWVGMHRLSASNPAWS
jgi:FAD:protein FMN transferase